MGNENSLWLFYGYLVWFNLNFQVAKSTLSGWWCLHSVKADCPAITEGLCLGVLGPWTDLWGWWDLFIKKTFNPRNIRFFMYNGSSCSHIIPKFENLVSVSVLQNAIEPAAVSSPSQSMDSDSTIPPWPFASWRLPLVLLIQGTKTVEDTWQLNLANPSSADQDLERFRSKVQAACVDILRQYGGPDAFLRARFSTGTELQGWVDYLNTLQDQAVVPIATDAAIAYQQSSWAQPGWQIKKKNLCTPGLVGHFSPSTYFRSFDSVIHWKPSKPKKQCIIVSGNPTQ